MPNLTISPRTKLKRVSKRASYDIDFLNSILDEAKICHIASIYNDSPLVIPTAYWRVEDKIYFHGNHQGRLSVMAKEKSEVCISISLLDGIVFAASAFAHSMNYRSVMMFGHLESIDDKEQQLFFLEQFMDQLVPGRWSTLRLPNKKEMNATGVFCMDIKEASIKFRQGPPTDLVGDESFKAYSGVLPVKQVFGPFERGPYCDSKIKTPDYSRAYSDYWVDE